MATLPISESRRRYSWWWDSHISPKNSRWLQDNLTDMDMKVKAMIKLIEEDADSFARRAEMYYKKRPELMKLVEEFYRAYRALAERYDQATGALRQAHRTMTEAFPNQIALMSPDDSPYASSNNSIEPHTPEVPPPVRAFFCSEDLPKDTSGLSSDFHALSRNGTYSEDNNSLPSKRGLKQLNEMFGSGEARVKKGLNFLEEDGELDNKERKGYREPQKVREKHDINVIKDLQQDVSRLSTENQNLKTQAMEESDRANKAVSEIQSLKDRLSELNSQKDADLLQYQKSLERVSILESQLSNAQSDMQKLKSDVLIEAQKVSNIEEHNRSLYLELEKLEKKAKMQEHELKLKQDEFSEVTIALQEKERQCTESQLALLAKEKQLIESEEEVKLLNLEIQKGMEKLRDIQLSKRNLQEKICKLKEENDNLKEENINSNLSIKDLQAEIILLKDKHKKLTEEIEFHIGEKEILDQEFCHLKEGRSELERKHQEIVKKMEIIVLNSESLHATIMGLQTENFELKENCKTWEPEKNLLMEKLEHMGEISERNKTLEYSISELNIELGVQKEKNLALNGSLESLNHELSTCISERDSLVSQYETLIQDLKFLSDKNSFLGNALSEAKLEIHALEGKAKDFEKSCQSLEDQSCIQRETISALKHSNDSLKLELSICISEKDSLVSQLGNLTNDVENLSEKNNVLDNALFHANSQVDQLKAKLANCEASCQYFKEQNAVQTDKIAALNASHEFLNLELSTRICERDSLTSQLESLTQERENLSVKSKLLDIALSKANVEGQELKTKLKDLEESCQSLKDSNDSLNLELSARITERDSVISQLEILTQNMENLSGKNNLLENMLSDAKSEVTELNRKLKDLEESYQSLKDQNCTQREEIASLNVSYESLNLELSTCIAERDAFVSQLEILTQSVGNLSEKNNFLENALSDANSEVRELKEKVKDLEESCQSLKDQNCIQSEKIATLNDSNDSLNLELSARITERDSVISQLEILTQNMENLSGKNNLLENMLSDAKSEVIELKRKLKDLEESYQSLKDQNCTQREEIASLNVSYESLNLELSTCIAERDAFVSQLEILTQSVGNLSEKNNFLENALSDANSEVRELKEKVKDLEESCQSLKDQNCIQSEKIAALNDSNDSLNLELSTRNIERDSVISQLQIFTVNMENLLGKNNVLENALSDAKSKVAELNEKLKDLEESCQTLKDQNCTQSEKIASLNISHESLNVELSTCIAERDGLISQLEILTQRLGNFSEKNDLLENALSDAKSEVGELNSKVKNLEESCQTLHDRNCTQSEKIVSLNISHDSLNAELSTCIAERDAFISQLEILTQRLGNFSEKNDLLENALSDAKSEVAELKAKVEDLEESCQTLNYQNSTQSERIASLNDSHESLNLELLTCIAERDSFVSQLEILTKNVGYLSENKNFLEKALSISKSEVGELKEKVKDLEESCWSLKDQNCTQSEQIASLNDSYESLNLEISNCIAERDRVVSQLDTLIQSVEDLSEKSSLLEIAKSELEELKVKLKDSEESCQILKDQNFTQNDNILALNDLQESLNLELSARIAERDSLLSQLEILTQNVENLSEKNNILDNAFSGAKSEVLELKEKLRDLEESCQSLKDQNFNMREKNAVLNDSCESLNLELSNITAERDSVVSQLEILTLNVNNLSEKNNFLENALSYSKIEVDGLTAKLEESEKSFQSLEEQNHIQQEKFTALNNSYESLNLELSTCITERDSIVSQLEIFTKNAESLSRKSNTLENALCLVTFEVEESKAEVKEFQEYCQSLKDENINLLAENNALTSQVQSITSSLDNLGSMLAELRDKHAILSRERDLSINQINELEILLKLEKEEHTNVIQSYKAQITDFGNIISLLQEENHLKHKEIEEEQDKSIASMVEIFILQTTLSEAHERNLILSLKANKHLERCRKAEELVSQLEQEKSIQMSKLLSSAEHNEKLIHGIRLFSNTLLANKGSQLIDDIQVDVLLDIILIEVGKLLNVISDNEFENQQFHLEVSILSTLLRHAALDVVNLRSERCHLEQELKVRAEEILSFENKHAELLDLNAQLMKKCEQNIEMEQVMKAEIEAFSIQLSNLQEALQTSTVERLELMKEKATLSVEVCNLKQKHFEFEKEHAEILQEAMKQCHHHLFFKSLSSERLAELKSSSNLNEQLMDNIEASKQREELLKAELGVFSTQINALHKALQESEYQILKLIEEKETLSDELCKLKRKHSDSEVRNIEILAEAMRLEHLYLYFKNLSAERLTELKSYNGFHEHLMQNIESKKQREKLLSSELGVLSLQLNRLQESFQASQAENLMRIQERDVLSEELHNLKKKYYDLEEEHNDVLAEIIKLNHLHLYFKSLSLETLLVLKSTDCDITSLRYIKSNLDAEIVKLNGEIGMVKLENMQLMDSVTCLEELRNSLLNLEFDLNNARSFYDELYLQSESLRNEVIQKEKQLLEANEKVKSTDEKNVELLRTLQAVQLQIEESKLVKEELEMKNMRLTEAISQSNKEIIWLQEGSAIMQKEIDKINEEVEVLTTRETHLLTALQNQTNEVECCELEINALLSEIQILTVNAAIYEEKAHELTLEGVISYMVEKLMLTMEVTFIKDHIDVAKKMINDLEEQIKELVAETTSLHILEVTSNLKALNDNERKDMSLEPHQQHCNDSQPRAGNKSMSIAMSELEQFIAKADALQKMIMNVRAILKQERFDCNSSLVAARKEAKEVWLRTLDGQTDLQESKNFSMKLDENGVKNYVSKEKIGQMMKDIQLDQASSSSHYIDDGSNRQHVSGNSEIDDQLWEAAERECHNQSQKVSEVDTEHDIETVEEEKSEYPSSELLPEKELNIDMLGALKKHLLSKQEWNKKIVERLNSDAVRLSDIKTSVEELERKMDGSSIGKLPPNVGYDTIKAQLKEAEANVLELMDVNSNLTKNVASSHGSDTKHGEKGSMRRRQISEDARKTSEKVGKLELELQKIQYILLKLEEEHENKRSKAVHRRSRVLLRDFLYGRKENGRLTKKSCFCGCMRPKTNDEQ